MAADEGRPVAEDAPSMPDKVCFVIGPIGSEGTDRRRRSDQVLNHIIRPVVEDSEFGYVAIRADKIAAPGLITQQVVQHIVSDELVVADLSEGNPNVYYELAIRHGVNKPFVQLIDAAESLPFDVADQRTIAFDIHDLDSVEAAKKSMRNQIAAIHHGASEPSSPLSFAVELQQLRGSDNPVEQSNAEILYMLDLLLNLGKRTLDAIGGGRTARENDASTAAYKEIIAHLLREGRVRASELEPLFETSLTSHTAARFGADMRRMGFVLDDDDHSEADE